MKRSRVILSSIISIILGGVGIVSATSALEYQSNPVDIKFEFGSTLSITTGGNISISDLTPGTKAISASNYNVTVSTNNLTGYTLSATVGCSSGTDCYDSKNLSDGTNTFSMLSTDGALTAGTWGVSLDSNATANSNFKTLAKYDETATILNQTTNNTGTAATGYTGTANTTVRVGAYATTSQVAGTYTNSINFIAVANAMPEFMQDMTAARLAILLPNSGDITTLYDKRDGAAYAIGKIADGKYWMLDNLTLDPTTTPLATLQGNTNASNAELGYLKNGGGSTSDQYATAGVANWTNNNSSYSYSTPLVNISYIDTTVTSYGPGSGKVGAYYNYCAASAGSYCYGDGSSTGASSGNATSDICPSGWRMPAISEYQALLTAYNLAYEWNDDFGESVFIDNGSSTGLKYALSLPLSGWFESGSADLQDSVGDFWSSTRLDDSYMYILSMAATYIVTYGDYRGYSGKSVRCLFGS